MKEKILEEREGRSFSGNDSIELMRAVIAKGASFRVVANGYSMTPFIRFGDVITITPLDQKKIHVGAVVAFEPSGCGKLVAHRVVARRGGACLIKGDNVWQPDGVVPWENILGQVKKTERKGRALSLGLGREGCLIAFLSHRLAFFSLLMVVWKWVRPILGRRNDE